MCDPRKVCQGLMGVAHQRSLVSPWNKPAELSQRLGPASVSMALGRHESTGTGVLAALCPLVGCLGAFSWLPQALCPARFLHLTGFTGLSCKTFKSPNSCSSGPRRRWLSPSYKVPNFCILSISFHFHLQSIQFFLKPVSFS